MLFTMTATIIQFPDRRTVVERAAGRHGEARQRQNAVTASFSTAALMEDGEDHWICRAHHVLDHVADLLDDGHAREVITLCEQGLWCLLTAAPDIADGDAVMALIDRLRALHRQACDLDPPDPVHLAEFVYGVARSEEMGVLHGVIDPYVALLGPVGLAEIRRRLAAEERRMRRLSDIARRIHEFRLRPIYESLSRADHPSAG